MSKAEPEPHLPVDKASLSALKRRVAQEHELPVELVPWWEGTEASEPSCPYCVSQQWHDHLDGWQWPLSHPEATCHTALKDINGGGN